jgi:hypothetical protein
MKTNAISPDGRRDARDDKLPSSDTAAADQKGGITHRGLF